jgi:hypothetical protein
VGRIILIKATGEIVLLCRLLTDPFIRAILSPSPPYLLYPGYVIPMWCHSASAYEKSTPLHSYTLHTSHPPHAINSRRNYRISNTHTLPLPPTKIFLCVLPHLPRILFFRIVSKNGKVCTYIFYQKFCIVQLTHTFQKSYSQQKL